MEPRLCPSCRKPLAPDVPMGLCPECLIKAGFPTGTGTETGAQSSFVPPTIEEIAKLFPQLEILELIGKGGMGAVYKARQKQLNRFVALKILPPGIGSDPAFAERFTREARALAQLNHPNIVTLYEFGEASGQFYFLMEFVDGVNLRQLLNTSRVAPREALAIVPQICDALQFAHDQGIVHRDIKPENILLDRRGRVKVADFGLAKLMGTGDEPAAGSQAAGSTSLTDAGKIMGTPNYMSPEQKENPGDVDHRADIYALGVVFYQMLTGELPGQRIESPSKKVHLDVRLDEIVLRALAQKPELRYQQASVLKTELETIATGAAETEAVANQQKPKTAPRFSRTAIVGLIFVLAGFVIAPRLFTLTLQMPGDLSRLNHVWVMTRWAVLVFMAMAPLVFGTLLGWVSISQIRRSGGKLYGLRLAVFDGITFPLLALDGVFSLCAGLVLFFLRDVISPLHLTGMIGLVANIIVAAVDLLVVLWVWNLVKKPATPAEIKPGRFWRWFAAGALAMIAVPFVISLLGLLAGITIPDFLIFRRSAQAEHDWGFDTNTLLRFTIRVLDVPGDFNRSLLLRPSGLLDTGKVKILAAPYAVMRSGNEGEIDISSVTGMDTNFPGAAILSGRAKILYIHPKLRSGSAFVEYSLDALIDSQRLNSTTPTMIRSGKIQLEEMDLMEEHGLANGRIQLAVMTVETEILMAPANSTTAPTDSNLATQGWQLWQAGKLEESVAKFREAVFASPQDANAWNGLGWADFNSGKHEEAERAFKKAIALDPDQAGALNGLGQIYLSEQKFAEAEQYLLRAAPNAPAAQFGLGRLYLLQGKFDEAKEWLQRVVDSGQADEIAKQMLAAASEKKLNDALRRKIDPATQQSAAVPPAAKNQTDWLKIQPLDGWISDVQSSDAKVQKMAKMALADLGTNIFPPMFAFLDDPTNQDNDAGERRYNMVQAVTFIGPAARAALPRFTEMLKSGRQVTAYSGAVGLAYSSPAVPEAISILTNALTNPAPGTRDAGIYGIQLSLSLWPNDPAQVALPLIIKNTTDPLDYIRSDAAVALMTFTQHQCQRSLPVPDFIISALIKLLSDKYYYSRSYALTALNNSCLAEKMKPYVPAVRELINDPNNEVRTTAAALLKRIDPTSPQAQESILDDQPPVVVETSPVSGAEEITPGKIELRVRFSKKMRDNSWSWSSTGEGSEPEIIGKPHYEADGKTCVLNVKLRPDHLYSYWLNSDQYKNFTDAAGQPAVPYLLVFQTAVVSEPLSNYSSNFVANFGKIRLTNETETIDLNIQTNVVSAACFDSSHRTYAALGPDWHPSGNWFVYVAEPAPGHDLSLQAWAYDGGAGLWVLNVSPSAAGWTSRDNLRDKPPSAVIDRLPESVKKTLQ